MSKKSNAAVVESTETTTTETSVVTHDIKALMEQYKTKSAVIRHLHSLGMKRGDIVKVFTDGGVKMIYQHVRNVLVQTPKKA